jgi:endonuclease/exonuclease/phosphatase family metal-dependent hydrolase
MTDRDFSVRVSQSTELRDFIARMTKNDSSPIFLLGDMNINSIGEEVEYQKLMSTLQISGYSLTDSMKNKGHPVTTAKSLEGGKLAEEGFTQKSDGFQPKSIDYVFIYDSLEKKNIISFDANVEKWTVSGKPYKQLSDHFAVKCTVRLAV